MSREEHTPDFICAICRRRQDMRWNVRGRPGEIIPPICLYCEHEYSRGTAKPRGGSFRDRRLATQLAALAAALQAEACATDWQEARGVIYAAA